MIIRWPGKIEEGKVSNETVCLTDFFATFATLLGVPVPEDAGEDSFNILPVLLGKEHSKPLRGSTIHHSISGQFAIRKGDWKLIEGSGDGDYPRTKEGKIDVKTYQPVRVPETGKWDRLDYFEIEPDGKYQLFNLKNDPKELKNIAEEYPEKVKELRDELDRVRDSGRSER